MNAEVEDKSEASPFIGDAIKISVKEKEEPNDNGAQHGNKDITSGFWIFKGPFLQRFATEMIFVGIFGIAGCVIAMTFSYFNGTMTTLEKRYKIPTKIFGVISIGNDITAMIGSLIVGYYLQKVHRPRWMALGLLITSIFCLMNLCLHFFSGAGKDALNLTQEFGNFKNISGNATTLCSSAESTCITETDSWAPIIILFVAQLILGIGSSILLIVGVAYMDDNSKKSKAPAMLTFSTCIRMLGPAIGYLLSSICLKRYIEPHLSPVIKPEDPRWLGAWWLGYILLTFITIIIAFVISLFPKELPSCNARRLKLLKAGVKDPSEHKELSLSDMWRSVKGLLNNKVFLYNLLASIVYFFGYNVYWNFSQKYIEIQYRQSASSASMSTGPMALGFSAVGVVLSGYVLTKYKPKARSIVAWNVIVDFLTVAGILCYALIGCEASDQLGSMATVTDSCSASCHCEYVHYAPICSPNNVTYISACHAGCTKQSTDQLGRIIYTGCGCITDFNTTGTDISDMQTAIAGPCPVDCSKQFFTFLAVMCFLKLVGASSKSTNFLITLRCIPPDEKSFGLGLGGMICSLFAFIPSPIFFGWLIDKYCLVWGKTCGSNGNCWLYDTHALRYVLNFTAAAFILIGGFFNIAVWYYAKDLQIFDENTETDPAKKTAEYNNLKDPGNSFQNKDHKTVIGAL